MVLHLDNIHPDQIFYGESDEWVVEFRNPENELSNPLDSLSQLKWMAPEILLNNSKPVSNLELTIQI